MKSSWVRCMLLLFIPLLMLGCQKEQTDSSYEVLNVSGIGALANSYIVASDGEAALIDPGQVEQLMDLIEEHSLTPKLILLTHGHFDHITGIQEILRNYPGVRILVHQSDAKKLTDPEANVSELFGTSISVDAPVSYLKGGQTVNIGKVRLKVIETPGHTSGSVSFQVGTHLFTGDTLMKEAVGRTDFPDGSAEALTKSLAKLMAMPSDLNVLPGHGDPTTIGDEKASNPYLR